MKLQFSKLSLSRDFSVISLFREFLSQYIYDIPISNIRKLFHWILHILKMKLSQVTNVSENLLLKLTESKKF